ncbi:MAG: hypothetical protein U0M60_01385 [Clostridia bacterium]|nr:hypothetical protein [Clostridia bacterium]
MPRYIDADALEEYIQETICAKCGDISDGIKCKSCGIDDTLDFLENAPTEDVVPRSEVEKLEEYIDDLNDSKEHLCVMLEEARSDVAREIIDDLASEGLLNVEPWGIANLKKKYTEK